MCVLCVSRKYHQPDQSSQILEIHERIPIIDEVFSCQREISPLSPSSREQKGEGTLFFYVKGYWDVPKIYDMAGSDHQVK